MEDAATFRGALLPEVEPAIGAALRYLRLRPLISYGFALLMRSVKTIPPAEARLGNSCSRIVRHIVGARIIPRHEAPVHARTRNSPRSLLPVGLTRPPPLNGVNYQSFSRCWPVGGEPATRYRRRCFRTYPRARRMPARSRTAEATRRDNSAGIKIIYRGCCVVYYTLQNLSLSLFTSPVSPSPTMIISALIYSECGPVIMRG